MTRFGRIWTLAAALGLALTARAGVPGDSDQDGDVDAADFAELAACQFGPELPSDAACQDTFDVDADTDVDLHDIAAFQLCFSGDGQPGLPDCVGHIVRVDAGCLQIVGTAADTVLTLRLRPGLPHVLDIDVDSNDSIDFSFLRDEFDCIEIDARGGDDIVFIDESAGVFTDTELTTINGGPGADLLIGGAGAERFIGGAGADTIQGRGGSDTIVWNPGDESDIVEGGEGTDTVEVNGSDVGESFTVTANGARVRFDRLSPTPFALDIGTCEQLVLRANGGDDALACTGNLAALIQITADGGAGNDTLLGSNGADVLLGGDDDDFLDGNQGSDVALLGAGSDTFQWDPGDGNDTVEGQGGEDTIVFNGSGTSEIFDFSANGARLRLTRNVASIVLDADGVERFLLRALGGADSATVHDLGATSLGQIDIDLAGTFGGSTGDGQVDSVAVAGDAGPNAFGISADGAFVVVDLAAAVRVRGYEVADEIAIVGVGGDTVTVNGSAGADTMTVISDGARARVDVTGFSAAVAVSGALSLTVRGGEGPDAISCTGNLAGLAIPLTLDGGPGDDTLLGSNGADLLVGGDGDDFVDGNQGGDVALLGPGEDIFQWDPGDGSDTVEGQGGVDALMFNGSGTSELLDLAANGARLRLTRNVGNVVMDVAGIEHVELATLGAADTVTINDLAGLEVSEVHVDLAGTLGGAGGDAQPDAVIVNATDGADKLTIAGGITGTIVSGLSAFVSVSNGEAALDRLTVNALGGDDVVSAGGLGAGIIGLTLSGGAGNDTLTGSHGADLLSGDDDNDTLIGGAGGDILQGGSGSDTIVWNPGDESDIVEGGEGTDTVEVNGSDVGENFTVTANGARVRFDRLSPTPFALDIGTCEQLVLRANGGDDALACTGNLAALIQITADGGAGNDTLLGSNGADVLLGGDDDDFLDGNQGSDVALLGAGSDTFQWDPGDGNDTVEGQGGEDTIVFNGSGTSEIFDFSANGARLRFTRNVASIVLDADGVERFLLRALGGADSATVHDLGATSLGQIDIDLAGTFGGSTGDGQADSVVVNGSALADTIHVAAVAGAVEVAGLAATVRLAQTEPASDTLTVNGLGGTDAISADPGVPALIMLIINP